MNESEERRRQLLRQTKRLYEENSFIPAIHPRYGHIYHDLYDKENKEGPKGSFFFRFSLGLLCFICYVWMDYGKMDVASVNSDKIRTQIEKQMDLDTVEEVWKNL